MDDEKWDTLEAQLAFALQERDRDPGDFLLAVNREEGEVVLKTGDGVPGSRLTFTMEEGDFDKTVPRLAREMVNAALGQEE